MGTESKFLVLDDSTFPAIEALLKIGEYTLSDAKVQLVEDTFLDTENKAFLAEGYYLRARKTAGDKTQLITLKSLGGLKCGAARRKKYACLLKEGQPILNCPQIRNMALEFAAGMGPAPFLTLKQKREVFEVHLGKRHVAELSLGRVNLKSETREKSYPELELKLKSGGTPKDLETLRAFLLEHYRLAENPYSKFELAFIFKEELPEKTLLDLMERAFCLQLAGQKDIYGKQAKTLLALDRGRSEEETALLLRTPLREICALRLKFEKKRLCIFPFAAGKNEKKQNKRKQKLREFPPGPWACRPQPGCKKTCRKATGCKDSPQKALVYEAEDRGAKRVQEWAFFFFDRLFPCHGFGPEERKLLGLSALVTGRKARPSKEKAGTDTETIPAPPLKGLKPHELRILALIVELHAQKVSEKNLDPAFREAGIRLSSGDMDRALGLAALLRLADFSLDENLKTGKVRELEGRGGEQAQGLEIEITGAGAKKAAKRAKRKAELFEYLFGTKLQFKPENRPADLNNPSMAKETQKLAARAEDSVAGLARRTFALQFSRMLAHEKGAGKGEEGTGKKEDREELHNMRVAARRMREAITVFGGFLDPGKLEPYLKGLKMTLHALGEARDLDVFWENAESYRKSLPPECGQDLSPLFSVLALEREKTRKRMLGFLESKKYGRFKKDFSDYLAAPEAWAPPAANDKHNALPTRVKDVLPSVLYARFADMSAYSEGAEGSEGSEGPYIRQEELHRLRIAAKGLRYTLEFFEGALGAEAKTMVKDLKTLQDHLGALHDSAVAIDLLDSYLRTGVWGRTFKKNDAMAKKTPNRGEGLEGVENYLEYRKSEFHTLLDSFPEVWAKFGGAEFRKRI